MNRNFALADVQKLQAVLHERALAWKAGHRSSPRFK